jgi:predicted phosphoribosyltransferase
MLFKNRTEAGEILASQVERCPNLSDVLVLGLPRGGVPVAFPVAQRLHAPLDVFVVRKVGVPGREELAMGAAASGGVLVRNPEVLHLLRLPDEVFRQVAEQERQEVIRREQTYRAGQPPIEVGDRSIVLVDDGLATGASMRAAVQAVRQGQPRRLVVAVPVAARAVADQFRAMPDEFVCVYEPYDFQGVSRWYEDFSQTSDEEVRRLLHQAAAKQLPTEASNWIA